MSATTGSTSSRPDLDWSQLRETVLMLNLAVAQIEQSMHEGDSSVETLAHSFTALATNLQDIQESIQHIHCHDDEENQKIKTIIQGSAVTASDKVQAAIIAFQFYDKLTQRLDHVSHSLAELSKLIANPEKLYSPPHWRELQDAIRSKYTMEEERSMFDKLLSGMSVEQALSEFKQEMASTQQTNQDDDIELF